jgi:hypothetical protein
MVLSGFGYLLSSFTHFLLPNYAVLFSIFELMAYGEVLFMVWVFFKGAKIPETKS